VLVPAEEALKSGLTGGQRLHLDGMSSVVTKLWTTLLQQEQRRPAGVRSCELCERWPIGRGALRFGSPFGVEPEFLGVVGGAELEARFGMVCERIFRQFLSHFQRRAGGPRSCWRH
jgi:hypothetical protein